MSTYWKDQNAMLKYTYSFADDGGATGTIDLGDLPDNFIVTEMFITITTTITSDGTPTITLGEDGAGGDVDGYFADFFGTPDAGTSIKGGGSLISGGVHAVAAAKNGLQITIGTAALTAGAFKVLVRGYQA